MPGGVPGHRVDQPGPQRRGEGVALTGDGELQEGQNWEALQSAAHDRLGGLWIVVDRNELQSDRKTEEILALGIALDRVTQSRGRRYRGQTR